MQILPESELERRVRQTFPGKPAFLAEAEPGIGPRRQPIVPSPPSAASVRRPPCSAGGSPALSPG
jgi:hypothetical protein